MKEEKEKIYFQPGDVVVIKQDIDYKPKMIVVKKKTCILKDKENNASNLLGISCRWFNANLDLQEAIFNTKDLIKL